MKKKYAIITIIIVLIIILSAGGFFYTQRKNRCPDKLFQDKMPGSFSEHFEKDGRPMQISDDEIEWIKKNCDFKVEVFE